MLTLLVAGWLTLPIAPLNPVHQDTMDVFALHFSAGMHISNGKVGNGPGLSASVEALATHPVVLRLGIGYRTGDLEFKSLPDGEIRQGLIFGDVLYYRGTNHLMGYLGIGLVYSFGNFEPKDGVLDSLLVQESVIDLDFESSRGYRLLVGLRIRQSVSFEIIINEVESGVLKIRGFSQGETSRRPDRFRNASFAIKFGYLFTLFE